jgi:outer membrane putative beta-barrel porin/alpha-amylase
MGRASRALPFFFLLSPWLVHRDAEAATKVDFRFLPAYFSGTYGTGIDTAITYLPLIMVVSSDRQEFRLTVPYLSTHTSEPVLYLGGEVIGPIPGGSTSESGIGDVVAQEEVFFLQGTAHRPWLSGILRIKFPTADESKGLGSGETDYGGGLGIIQPLTGRWTLIGAWQYIVRGDPPGVDFQNTTWLTIGAEWRHSARSSWNAFYDSRQSVIAGRTDLNDFSVGYDRIVSPRVTFRSMVFFGLTSTAEDFGISAGLSIPTRRH